MDLQDLPWTLLPKPEILDSHFQGLSAKDPSLARKITHRNEDLIRRDVSG